MSVSGRNQKAKKQFTILISLLMILAGGWKMQVKLIGKQSSLKNGSTSLMTKADDSQSQSTNINSQAPSRQGEIKVADPAQSGLAKYPDLPLTSVPETPISSKFLVEHRTFLSGKVVRVCGVVVRTGLKEETNPSSGVTPNPGANPQSRIFLADTSKEGRDKNYDLMVLLREGDDRYGVSETAEIKGVVESSKVAVYLRKIY